MRETPARPLLQLLTQLLNRVYTTLCVYVCVRVCSSHVAKGWKVKGWMGNVRVNSDHGSATRHYVNIAVENV